MGLGVKAPVHRVDCGAIAPTSTKRHNWHDQRWSRMGRMKELPYTSETIELRSMHVHPQAALRARTVLLSACLSSLVRL